MSQPDNENLNSLNETEQDSETTEDIEETSLEDTDDAAKLKEQNTKLAEANKKLFERAKKAEGFVKGDDGKWVKKSKPQPKPESTQPLENKQPNTAQLDPDELKLIAKGLSDKEIEQAKVVSKGKGISLMEAIKDDLFITFQEKMKEEEKKENAKLGASKGSGQEEPKSDFRSGMSADEHKKAWKERMGR